MNDNGNNRNLILAVLLSAAVLFGWHHHPTGADVQVSDLRIAHLAIRQANIAA